MTAFFLNRQDRWLLLIGAGLVSAACLGQRKKGEALFGGVWLPLAVALILLSLCSIGHEWVLSDYDMSRDEQMATFDAAIFATGGIVQKIPVLWRDHADALNTLFMYPAVHRGAWVSSYLPFNAIFRALLGIVGASSLTGPLMTAIGAIALWGCARRIWPHSCEAAVVALLLYVGSGQVVVAGMTAYAMPAHLACNLVWLWLFLHRAWWADMAALAVGFVAVGLHQPLMHPMFAAPLLVRLLFDGQWLRAVLYVLGYAAIGAFWLWWPSYAWLLVQAAPNARLPVGVDYVTRFITTVQNGDPTKLPDIIANLLRFVAWQHLLLLPLILLGWKVARTDRLAASLAMGILLTTVVMATILPYQGHGFGYRYLHGLIGNCILLSVFGWESLDQLEKWRGILLRATIASCAITLPIQLWMAHCFYAPAAQVNARIAQTDADYVIIGANVAPFSIDLVRNPPALNVRPLRLISERVNTDIVYALCHNQARVALVGDRMFDRMNAYYGVVSGDPAARQNAILAPQLEIAGCRVQVLR